MTKTDIATHLAEKLKIPKSLAEDYVDEMFHFILKELEEGKKITIKGFGTFSIQDRQARVGRNPKTKEEFEIPEHKVLVFHASDLARETLNDEEKK